MTVRELVGKLLEQYSHDLDDGFSSILGKEINEKTKS
jgi:hypothetical protein